VLSSIAPVRLLSPLSDFRSSSSSENPLSYFSCSMGLDKQSKSCRDVCSLAGKKTNGCRLIEADSQVVVDSRCKTRLLLIVEDYWK
jgi:hypothetical protein